MRRCLKGLGGFPTSTDGFILGPSHGTVGRLAFSMWRGCPFDFAQGRLSPASVGRDGGCVLRAVLVFLLD
jgi:hypothetical protein